MQSGPSIHGRSGPFRTVLCVEKCSARYIHVEQPKHIIVLLALASL